MIAAIIMLVILSSLAAAIVSLGTTQSITSAQDVMSTKAWQAAKAGNEFGLYQALKPTGIWYAGAASDPCPLGLGSGTQKTYPLLDLTADTGFSVAISANCWKYNEGEATPGVPTVVRIYKITAVACNASACPTPDASALGYVERSRTVIATR